MRTRRLWRVPLGLKTIRLMLRTLIRVPYSEPAHGNIYLATSKTVFTELDVQHETQLWVKQQHLAHFSVNSLGIDMKILVRSRGCELWAQLFWLQFKCQEETSLATIQQNPLTCIPAAEEECGLTKVKHMWCSGQAVRNKQQLLQTLLFALCPISIIHGATHKK